MPTKEKIESLPTANWTRADYDAHKALNQTLCKELLRSPLHYQAALNSQPKQSDALLIGSLTHLATLEPELFASQVICLPEDAPKRPTEKQRNAKKPKPETLEAITWWQSFEESSKGKTVADPDHYQAAQLMAAALRAELEAHKVTPIATELSLICSYGALNLKGQIDLISQDGWIYDLKTIGDYISPRKILSTVYQRAYHLQAAFYLLLFREVFGERAQGFRLVFVEKSKPNATATFELSPELVAEGQTLMLQAFETYKAASEFNSWTGYPKTIQTLKPWKSQADTSLPEITFA